MEDSRSVAGWMGGQEILTGEILTVDEVIAIVDAITAGELKQLAGELLTGERLRLAAVGPIDPDGPWEDLLRL
jgi:predicted Zn-dependent peptidase